MSVIVALIEVVLLRIVVPMILVNRYAQPEYLSKEQWYELKMPVINTYAGRR